MNKNKILGSSLALAAAALFSTIPAISIAASSTTTAKQVACYGVNSCKGKSQCKTATSSCKGDNSCKGKGVLMMSKKDCLKKGGSLTPKQ